MTPTLEEHDYIGLSEASSNSSAVSSAAGELTSLKQTELRLGLPGSESPERVSGSGLTLGINVKGFGSGSKRGFSDALDGSPKWSFNGGKGSELELFSPKKGESGGGAKDLEKKKTVTNSVPVAK